MRVRELAAQLEIICGDCTARRIDGRRTGPENDYSVTRSSRHNQARSRYSGRRFAAVAAAHMGGGLEKSEQAVLNNLGVHSKAAIPS
jgi:hypothetical protein